MCPLRYVIFAVSSLVAVLVLLHNWISQEKKEKERLATNSKLLHEDEEDEEHEEEDDEEEEEEEEEGNKRTARIRASKASRKATRRNRGYSSEADESDETGETEGGEYVVVAEPVLTREGDESEPAYVGETEDEEKEKKEEKEKEGEEDADEAKFWAVARTMWSMMNGRYLWDVYQSRSGCDADAGAGAGADSKSKTGSAANKS